MTINFIMHRLLKYKIIAQELATITVGMTAESAVTPTVIVALSATLQKLATHSPASHTIVKKIKFLWLSNIPELMRRQLTAKKAAL